MITRDIIREVAGWLIVIVLLVCDYHVWHEAMHEPDAVSKESGPAWVLNGREMAADHISNTDPSNALSNGTMTVTGFDRDGGVLWVVTGVTNLKRLR